MIHWKEYCSYYKVTGDTIFTLDTETSSYWVTPEGIVTGYNAKYSNDEFNEMACGAVVYIWMIGIDDDVIYGRDLHELPAALERIREHIDKEETPCMFVHNLAYDFQFLRNVLDFTDVFARTQRKPMKASAAGFEFRCSYMLTRLSLESWGKQMNLEAKKQSGLLDYHVLRSPRTPLSDDELKYCEFDIKTMFYGLKRYKMKYGSVHDIVLTQTGEVRKPVKQMFSKDNGYHFKVTKMQPRTFDEYCRMKAVFAGGDTHANRRNACKIHKHVGSFDKSSDYPYQMCAMTFPMTRFTPCSTDLRFMKPDMYAYIIQVEFINIKSKCSTTYISKSHTTLADAGDCVNLDKIYIRGKRIIAFKKRRKLVCDNGRIIDAARVVMSITEQDLPIIKACYDIEKINVLNCWRSRKDYLPKRYIEFILDLYEKKTQLKGKKDLEDLYMQSKQFLNSLFGMMVTDILMAYIGFKNNEWLEVHDLTEKEINDKLEELHEKFYKNDLAYQWGIWVTAYARRELLEAVLHVGDDECYHDTDSVKMLHYWKYFDYFRMKDGEMDEKLKAMCKHYDIDFEKTRPRKNNGKGAPVPLGHWEFETVYREAKFEGAKKYCYNYASRPYTCRNKEGKLVDFHHIHITVAGVPKAAAAQLQNIREFKDGLEFDRETCGKKLLIYLDGNNCCVTLPDGYTVIDKYAVCMRNNAYTLGITDEYCTVVGVLNDAKGIIRFNVA